MSNLIDRQAAIDAVNEWFRLYAINRTMSNVTSLQDILRQLPSTQPTLYGYKIEHLAYIARVMEKEGVTADYAVRTFDDMGRAIKMIIDEVQQKVEEALNG